MKFLRTLLNEYEVGKKYTYLPGGVSVEVVDVDDGVVTVQDLETQEQHRVSFEDFEEEYQLNEEFDSDKHEKQIRSFRVALSDGDKIHAREFVERFDWDPNEVTMQLVNWFNAKGF